jgi:hypothetical protein
MHALPRNARNLDLGRLLKARGRLREAEAAWLRSPACRWLQGNKPGHAEPLRLRDEAAALLGA